jgi:hypothetical protein
MWRTLGLTAERLGEKTEDIRFQDLAKWLDSGDSHSLAVTRYLNRLTVATPTPINKTCDLHALDFLRLLNGWLNGNIIDAALESLCAQFPRTSTCTTLL